MSNAENVVTVKITEDDLAIIIAALEESAEKFHSHADVTNGEVYPEAHALWTRIAEARERIALDLHRLTSPPTRPTRYRITGYGHKGLTTTTTQEV